MYLSIAHDALVTEIDPYKACKVNSACENLYPEAEKAIQEAEDKKTGALETNQNKKNNNLIKVCRQTFGRQKAALNTNFLVKFLSDSLFETGGV